MNIVISNRQSVGYELNLNGLLYATSDSSTISSEDRRCQSFPTTPTFRVVQHFVLLFYSSIVFLLLFIALLLRNSRRLSQFNVYENA